MYWSFALIGRAHLAFLISVLSGAGKTFRAVTGASFWGDGKTCLFRRGKGDTGVTVRP